MGLGEKEREYARCDPGDYQVEFGRWFPEDAEGFPKLVHQTRFGEETLIFRYRSVIVAGEKKGEDGPVGSIDPFAGELQLLVRAFGGDPTDLPKITSKNVHQVASHASKLMTESTLVRVGETGWIGFMEGFNAPEGSYLFKFARVTSKNAHGLLSWIPGKYGPTIIGRCEISAGPFKGIEVLFFLDYPLELDDDLVPCLIRLKGGPKDGQLSAGSKRIKTMMQVFGSPPDEFAIDQVEDVYNIVPELVADWEKHQDTKLGWGYVHERGIMDLNKLTEPPAGVTIAEAPKPEAKEEEVVLPDFSPEPKEAPEEADKLELAQSLLRQTIANEVTKAELGEAWLDEKTFKLSPAGKTWARGTLLPIVQEAGMERAFTSWGVDEIIYLLDRLGYAQLTKPLKAEGEALAEEAKEEEAEAEDF